MSERAGFLRAIRAAPAEDTPRLAFADWLDEHGEPERAELIRAQCEIARLRDCNDLPVPAELLSLEFRMWGHYSPPIPKGWQLFVTPALFAETQEFGLLVERGFCGAARCPAADWLAHADAILAEHPVRRVRLTTTPELEVAGLGDGSVRIPGRAAAVRHTAGAWGWPSRGAWRETILRLLAAEWPDTDFELPPVPARVNEPGFLADAGDLIVRPA